ncbi:MAG: substrate-binding domain-containing protein [Akkermansiaceae bacterium]
MKPVRIMSAFEQVAEHLLSEIAARRLQGEMPGIHQLAAELSVNHKTVKAALELLQEEGVIASQGSGKPRRILSQGIRKALSLSIAVLLYEPDDRELDHILKIFQHLNEAGHKPFDVGKTLVELKMNVQSVARLVERTDADAWIVVAGSLPVLVWFSEHGIPSFGLYGRVASVPIASAIPYTIPALQKAIQHLIGLGHQRIVMIAREDRRKPEPGFSEQMFLNELEAHNIPAGSYNLPEWDESREGLTSLLDSLFLHTPPTAMLIQTPELATAVLMYCAHCGIRVPQQLSIVCMDPCRTYSWCSPAVSHIGFDTRPLMRRVSSWANNIAQGKPDKRMVTTESTFIEGETMAAPAM